MKSIQEQIEALISLFPSDSKPAEKEKAAIGLWFSKEYKDKYERLQEQSGKKFGKALQEIIKTAIDSVE